jgi:hypothetical protein
VGDVGFHRYDTVPWIAKFVLCQVFQQFLDIALVSKRKCKSHPSSSKQQTSPAI